MAAWSAVAAAILVVIALGVATALADGGLTRGPPRSSSSPSSIILLGAELFTNGIEWFGRKLDLAEGAVGSVLAAVGTALPETMIPIIAILFATGDVGATRSASGPSWARRSCSRRWPCS